MKEVSGKLEKVPRDDRSASSGKITSLQKDWSQQVQHMQIQNRTGHVSGGDCFPSRQVIFVANGVLKPLQIR